MQRRVAAARDPHAVADAHSARAAAEGAATRSRTACPTIATPSCARCRACTLRSRTRSKRSGRSAGIAYGADPAAGRVDRRRPRRQSVRHARRHAPRAGAAVLHSARFLPERGASAGQRAVAVGAHGHASRRSWRSWRARSPGPVRAPSRRTVSACADRRVRPAGGDVARSWMSMRRERKEVAPSDPTPTRTEFVRDLDAIAQLAGCERLRAHRCADACAISSAPHRCSASILRRWTCASTAACTRRWWPSCSASGAHRERLSRSARGGAPALAARGARRAQTAALALS